MEKAIPINTATTKQQSKAVQRPSVLKVLCLIVSGGVVSMAIMLSLTIFIFNNRIS